MKNLLISLNQTAFSKNNQSVCFVFLFGCVGGWMIFLVLKVVLGLIAAGKSACIYISICFFISLSQLLLGLCII